MEKLNETVLVKTPGSTDKMRYKAFMTNLVIYIRNYV